ncbi:MAG: PAS domain-containing protein [Gaiellales bacterium]
MPYFICPSCARRGSRTSRTSGFTDRPVACDRCGFGFLFELLDDYFPSPLAGIFVCDQQGRVLAFGRGARELSGYDEQELMGRDIAEALDVEIPDEPDGQQPHKTALEWGARVLDRPLTIRDATGALRPVTGDFFPAYDQDGGLLVVFTPRAAQTKE